jgi:3-oxoacyl-[acyl-carrier protein] reductase
MTKSQKSIVISGGASGIGLACAHRLALEGFTVHILDMNPELAQALASLPGKGHTASRVDVTDANQVEIEIAKIAAFGPITGLVVSAGIISQTPLLEISSDAFAKVLAVNVLGVQNVVAPIARNMVANSVSGSLVVLSSIAAFNGGGFMGRGAYSTSKAALLGLIRSYARELAPYKIRINNVAPGATETPMTEHLSEEARTKILAQTLGNRFLRSEEVVSVINYLISDESSAINGQTLHANGGSFFG